VFYAFRDKSSGLLWLIPLSSQVEKYRTYYELKIKRNGCCDTLAFGEVLGHEKAFLIQNMCPATEEYISNIYIDSSTCQPIRINHKTEKEIVEKAKKVLALHKHGKKIIFPDVTAIERNLLAKRDGT